MNSIFRIKFLAAAVLSLGAAVFAGNSTATENLVLQDLDYTDSKVSLTNPGRGWYRTQGLRLRLSENNAVGISQPLTHLRVDISPFSEKSVNSTGVSQPLTDDALNALNETFENARKKGNRIIVRTSYDIDGKGKQDPPQNIILGHVKQLAKVYGDNSDVIEFVELGMYGSWGEQHTSNNGSNAEIAEALQTMIENTPPEMKIGVRRPDIVAYWLGVQSETKDGSGKVTKVGYENFDINSTVFKAAVAAKGDTISRVGMYNDGYLGSYSDLGTVNMGNPALTRNLMIQWLEQYSVNIPYGGEMVANANGDHPLNTARYLSYEGFRTHTSYLNWEWHYQTIQDMKDSILEPLFGVGFRSPDKEYVGLSAYQYVEDHLGYRYVLRESRLIDTVASDAKFHGSLKIQNVGFGNLTQKRPAQLLLVEDVGNMEKCRAVYPIDLPDVDFRNVHSRTIQVNGSDTTMTFDGTNTLDIETSILAGGNDKLYAGNFYAYLKLDGIQFANKEVPITCDLENHALYLGKFAVDPKKEPPKQEETDNENSDNEKNPLNISNIRYIGHQKNQPSVERADNKIQVRDPRGSGESRYFRVNGKAIR